MGDNEVLQYKVDEHGKQLENHNERISALELAQERNMAELKGQTNLINKEICDLKASFMEHTLRQQDRTDKLFENLITSQKQSFEQILDAQKQSIEQIICIQESKQNIEVEKDKNKVEISKGKLAIWGAIIAAITAAITVLPQLIK